MRVRLFDLVIATLSRNVKTASMYQTICSVFFALHFASGFWNSLSPTSMWPEAETDSGKCEARQVVCHPSRCANHGAYLENKCQCDPWYSYPAILPQHKQQAEEHSWKNIPQDLEGTKANQLEEVHQWPMLPEEQEGLSQVNIFLQQSQTVSSLSVNWPGMKKKVYYLLIFFYFLVTMMPH